MKDKWNNSRKYGRRHNRFDVKLTDEELAIVKRKAEFAKMPVGRFLRVMAVKGELKYYDLKEMMALKRAFLSIGNNLNQPRSKKWAELPMKSKRRCMKHILTNLSIPFLKKNLEKSERTIFSCWRLNSDGVLQS